MPNRGVDEWVAGWGGGSVLLAVLSVSLSVGWWGGVMLGGFVGWAGPVEGACALGCLDGWLVVGSTERDLARRDLASGERSGLVGGLLGCLVGWLGGFLIGVLLVWMVWSMVGWMVGCLVGGGLLAKWLGEWVDKSVVAGLFCWLFVFGCGLLGWSVGMVGLLGWLGG